MLSQYATTVLPHVEHLIIVYTAFIMAVYSSCSLALRRGVLDVFTLTKIWLSLVSTSPSIFFLTQSSDPIFFSFHQDCRDPKQVKSNPITSPSANPVSKTSAPALVLHDAKSG